MGNAVQWFFRGNFPFGIIRMECIRLNLPPIFFFNNQVFLSSKAQNITATEFYVHALQSVRHIDVISTTTLYWEPSKRQNTGIILEQNNYMAQYK